MVGNMYSKNGVVIRPILDNDDSYNEQIDRLFESEIYCGITEIYGLEPSINYINEAQKKGNLGVTLDKKGQLLGAFAINDICQMGEREKMVEISNIAVRSNQRNNKYGSKMLKLAEKMIIDKYGDDVTAFVKVMSIASLDTRVSIPYNLRLKKFYEKNGYSPDNDLTRQYKDDPSFDYEYMRCAIGIFMHSKKL
ncbi:MAG: GNAT family N-acetyltransferase [Candidatus Nomurabacteria bacterium]|jgi:ribosomal protein S18 acetylase RimI-like enzyme|nr:GNAT family N-acetyltransferase [Candidatus Nomurabacteria bacterium]